MRRVAIDTGGTFTDCVLADEGAGTLTLAKVPSTPAMPAVNVGAASATMSNETASVEVPPGPEMVIVVPGTGVTPGMPPIGTRVLIWTSETTVKNGAVTSNPLIVTS